MSTPVVLLHGFPETSHMWGPLIGALEGDGYRCVAPDQRGYSAANRPSSVDAYRYEELIADVLSLADEHGFDRFHLVGHDWGAIVGWGVAARHGERLLSWTAMSVGHYRAFAEAVWSDPEQQTYRDMLGLFLSPEAEDVLGAALSSAWPAEHAAAYAEVFSQPGALTAALNRYRACDAHRRALDSPLFGQVDVPTLVLWGKNDPYVRRAGVEAGASYVTGPYRLVELDAGHFLVQERFEQVRDEVVAHLGRNAE